MTIESIEDILSIAPGEIVDLEEPEWIEYTEDLDTPTDGNVQACIDTWEDTTVG